MTSSRRLRGFGRTTSVLLVAAALICSPGFQSSALAGGASGSPGIIKFVVGTVGNKLKERHKIGWEYVRDNAKVKSLVEELAIDMALNLPDMPQTAIAEAIWGNIEAAMMAEEQGLSANVVHKLVENNLGAFVKTQCPPCGKPLGIAKLATAIATAYAYGVVKG